MIYLSARRPAVAEKFIDIHLPEADVGALPDSMDAEGEPGIATRYGPDGQAI